MAQILCTHSLILCGYVWMCMQIERDYWLWSLFRRECYQCLRQNVLWWALTSDFLLNIWGFYVDRIWPCTQCIFGNSLAKNTSKTFWVAFLFSSGFSSANNRITVNHLHELHRVIYYPSGFCLSEIPSAGCTSADASRVRAPHFKTLCAGYDALILGRLSSMKQV